MKNTLHWTIGLFIYILYSIYNMPTRANSYSSTQTSVTLTDHKEFIYIVALLAILILFIQQTGNSYSSTQDNNLKLNRNKTIYIYDTQY